MDYLRSCYEVDMIFRVGDAPIKVRWYFVDCEHENFPGWHSFGSANWVSRVCQSGAIGEQPGPRQWVNGQPPPNAGDGGVFAVACAEEQPLDWWESGIPTGEETGPYDENGLPVCCVDGPEPDPVDLCGCTTARSLVLTLHSPANPCVDDVPFVLEYDDGLGYWTNEGAEPQPCGSCFLELKWICINAFPTQWLLLIQFREIPGGPSSGCAGGSASVDFTQCLPISGAPVSVWLPDPGACPCTNGIVSDTVTFDLEELP